MTISFAAPLRSGHAAHPRTAGVGSLSPSALLAVGSLLSLVLSWPHLMQVWQTGTFYDTDDAMRMVQVRAWLAGQPWFDLSVHRLDPPGGVFMHWSRFVDLPLAGLLRLFGLFADAETAERLTRIVFPLALQVGLIAATLFTVGVLAGPAAALPAMLLIVTSCFQFGQFVAGRVDHHAPQITLLMLMTGLCADAMLYRRVRSAILLAVSVAASVAISLENLPFIAIVVAAQALTWVVRGRTQANVLAAFGLALPLCVSAAFLATVAPARFFITAPDAFSLPHLLAAMLGGPVLAALAWTLGDGVSAGRRAAALGGCGVALAALVAGLCPGVLASPYAQIDPVVRAVWLSRVTEALPLPTVLRLHPQAITLVACPLVVGLLAMGLAVLRERGLVRGAWLFVAALTAVGLAASFWEVRVISSTTPLAVLGGVWAFSAIRDRATRRGEAGVAPALRAILLLFVFAPMAWVLVPVPDETDSIARSTKDAESCRVAANVAALADLAPGLMFAPIDSGSHILVHTPLSVLGAPYHRNNRGNRVVIDGFSASPADAETIVKASGARYVALCPGQVQAEALTARNPDGLAAHLLADQPPPWLQPLTIAGTSYKVFAVR